MWLGRREQRCSPWSVSKTNARWGWERPRGEEIWRSQAGCVGTTKRHAAYVNFQFKSFAGLTRGPSHEMEPGSSHPCGRMSSALYQWWVSKKILQSWKAMPEESSGGSKYSSVEGFCVSFRHFNGAPDMLVDHPVVRWPSDTCQSPLQCDLCSWPSRASTCSSSDSQCA